MSRIRVLLVDDEADYARTLAERMEMRDVGTRVALNGEEALQMVEAETPDVMVVDLRMPGMDGMEVLERVKREHPHVQVIILTGHGSAREEEEANRLGAFGYLQKPADTDNLVNTIRDAWQAALDVLKRPMEALAEAGVAQMAAGMMHNPEGSKSGPLKVLLVDDEEEFVTTVADRMDMRELGSTIAFDGKQALEKIENEVPDVVVLDLRMPGIGGMEVLRRIKVRYPRIEVILLTGHGSDDDEDEARRLGAFDCMRKPIDINRLVETIWRAGQVSRGTSHG